uniref:Uncharacterized protein n=1 Tax=uncultured prokaryote TaxID=198431 RepID=A0A0H5QQ47_9ZZZZ|nr:hypothetical protein [uncultured prokaryote]
MGIFKVEYHGRLLGQEISNTSWVRGTGIAPTPEEAGEIADYVNMAFGTTVPGILSEQYKYTGCTVVAYGFPIIGATRSNDVDGDLAGAPAPAFVSAKVRFLTNYRGPLARARWGLAGLTEAQISGNSFDDGEQVPVRDAVRAYLALLDDGDSPCQIEAVSTVVDGAPRDPVLEANIVDCSVDVLLGSQVSRKTRS